jgi:hypothetical protein
VICARFLSKTSNGGQFGRYWEVEGEARELIGGCGGMRARSPNVCAIPARGCVLAEKRKKKKTKGETSDSRMVDLGCLVCFAGERTRPSRVVPECLNASGCNSALTNHLNPVTMGASPPTRPSACRLAIGLRDQPLLFSALCESAELALYFLATFAPNFATSAH